jgi:hypothetical protein
MEVEKVTFSCNSLYLIYLQVSVDLPLDLRH